MNYPNDAIFDIQTLIDVAQPKAILLLGNHSSDFLDTYKEHKSIIQQEVELNHYNSEQIDDFFASSKQYDVAIVIDLFEHLDKTTNQHILARLRDYACPQYCLCLPVKDENGKAIWNISDLFSFALQRVAEYNNGDFALFKYHIHDYKRTPNWLNADNWANPELWGKYHW